MRIDEYLRIYEAKHDDELLLLAGNSAELTDEARTALQSELARRGIKAEPLVIPDIAGERNVSSTRRVMKLNGPKTLAEFLKSVSSLYWNHFWLFVAFTVPVIAISYYLRVLAQGERNRLLTEFWSQGGESSRSVLILKISLINHASYFVSWLCFCVCYAGIASAVGQINTGHWPSALKCFVEFRRRPGAFFKVSILLYVILMAVGMVAALVFGALFSLLPTRIMLSPVGLMIMYGYVILVAVVVSRLALSIPAVTLGDYTVR